MSGNVQWKLNGVTLAERGVEDLAVSLREMSTSTMSFSVAADFDSAPQFATGAAVVLERVTPSGGEIIFQGKADPVNRAASPKSEGHDFYVSDAWQDLEETIYQEPWAVGDIEGGVLFPRAVLGIDASGERITTGAQIAAVIAYAATQGVAIQAGVIEAGHTLWPEEVRNISCAEVIRLSLKFTLDHVPWIDHSTSPPTLNVTARADMPLREIPLDGSGAATLVNYRRRDDILPESVRIIYETAQNIGGSIFRDAIIDKWPADGPDGGPRCLMSTVELAGMGMQFQKSPVQVRALPASQATGKDYLRAKFPQIKDVPDAAFKITQWDKTLVPEPDEDEEAHELTTINPESKRLQAEEIEHLPNELVRGVIGDWMRVRIGRVHLGFAVQATNSATDAHLQLLATLPPGFSVVATNAETKIYHGMTQWESGENAPAGIAQAVYESMTAAYEHQGRIILKEGEAGAIRYHGTKVRLTGTADPGLAAMSAIVHSVDLDITTGETEIGFGAPPHLAPDDFLELQRNLRRRPATWWSKKERTSNKLGVDDKPGSKGDTVTPYDVPETIFDATPAGPKGPCNFGEMILVDEDEWHIRGGVISAGEKNWNVPSKKITATSGEFLVWIEVGVTANMTDDNAATLSGLKTSTAPTWETASASGNYADSEIPEIFPESNHGKGKAVIPIGLLKITDGVPHLTPSGCGDIVVGHCPGSLWHRRFYHLGSDSPTT